VDSNGGSRFAGEIASPVALERVLSAAEIARLAGEKPGSATPPADISLAKGFTVTAWIKPAAGEAGRVFDKVTAGGSDGFLFDTHPGLALRLIVGADTLTQPRCLQAGEWQHIAATVDPRGTKRIYLNGKLLKQEGGDDTVPSRAHKPTCSSAGSPVRRTRELSHQVQRLDLHRGSQVHGWA